jgi:hypothetical protein
LSSFGCDPTTDIGLIRSYFCGTLDRLDFCSGIQRTWRYLREECALVAAVRWLFLAGRQRI